MATKKTQQNSDLSLDIPGSEADLDQAIDDLRGVLKQDADGDLSQFGDDLQSDPFAAGTDLAAFGGETSETPFGSDDFGGDFGGGDRVQLLGMSISSLNGTTAVLGDGSTLIAGNGHAWINGDFV